MRKILKYYWILCVVGLGLLVAGIFMWKTYHDLALVLLIVGLIIFISYGILEPYIKKEKMKEAKQKRIADDNSETGDLETHKDDNAVTKVIYSIYKGENEEIKSILENSICEVEFDYSKEDNMYSLGITSCDFKNKKNPVDFMLVLYSADNEKKMIVDSEEDISSLSEEELTSKVLSILKAGIKPYEVKEFEIKRPKSHLYLAISVGAVSIISSIVLIVLGILQVLESPLALVSLTIPAIFLFVAIWQLFASINQKFVYNGKEFKYFTFNKKEYSCLVSLVKRVYFRLDGRTVRIIFVDKDGTELLKISDDNWIAKDKNFLYALNKNRIKADMMYL